MRRSKLTTIFGGAALLAATTAFAAPWSGSGTYYVGTSSGAQPPADYATLGEFFGAMTGIRQGPGTISIAAAATAVVGTGTSFTTDLAVGDTMYIGANIRTITAIADDTNLTINSAPAAAVNNASYAYDRLAEVPAAVSGNVTVEILSNTTEAQNVMVLGDLAGNTLTVKPYAGTQPTVTFTRANDNPGPSGSFLVGVGIASFDMLSNNVDNFVIDGSNNGTSSRDLTLRHEGAFSFGSVVHVVGDNDGIVIKNTNLVNASTSTGGTINCIRMTGRTVTTQYGTFAAAGTYVPDNWQILNNNISIPTATQGHGILTASSGTVPAGTAQNGFLIDGNDISVRIRGIFINPGYGYMIRNNNIQVPVGSPGFDTFAIFQNSSNTPPAYTTSVYNNRVLVRNPTAAAGTNGPRAIFLGTSGAGFDRIIEVYNNEVVVENTGARNAGVNSPFKAIEVTSGITYRINNNTIHMKDNAATANNPSGTNNYAIGGFAAATYNATITNNNIVLSEAGTAGISETTVAAGVGTGFVSNDNNIHRADAGAFFGRVTTTTYASRADWNTATGRDAASTETNPLPFTHSANNLKFVLQPGPDFLGTAVAGITTDFEGQVRSLTTPTKGFDEINTAPEINVSPLALNYGSVPRSSSNDLNVTIDNQATPDVLVVALSLGGVNADQFSLVSVPASPFNIAALGSQVVAVRYTPTVIGSHTATLTITSSDPDEPTTVVNLSGTAVWGGSGTYYVGTSSGRRSVPADYPTLGEFFGAMTGIRQGPGTISIAAAATAVVGTGTSFTTDLAVGDTMYIGANIRTITAIADDTNLTIDSAPAAAVNNASYAYDRLAEVPAAVSGDITVEIISDITEPQNVMVLGDLAGNTLTIKPYTGTQPTVTFTRANDNPGPSGSLLIGVGIASFDMLSNNVDNVVIDGSNNGTSSRDLTLRHEGAFSFGSVVHTVGDNDGIVIKNTNIVNASTSTGSSVNGLRFTGRTVTTQYGTFAAAGTYVPDNWQILNNAITVTSPNQGHGILTASSGTIPAGTAPNNFLVDGNDISARIRGIFINPGYSYTIRNNTFTTTGILGFDTFGIFQNATNTPPAYTTQIYNNRINVENPSTAAATQGPTGIFLGTSGAGSDRILEVFNNEIVLENTGARNAGVNSNQRGIAGTSGVAYRIHNNSIHVKDNAATANNPSGTNNYAIGGFAVATYDAAITNNNIVLSEAGTAGISETTVSTGTFVSNDNNIHRADAGAFFGRVTTTTYASRADWNTATGRDAASTETNPLPFAYSADNLKFVQQPGADFLGTAVAGITTDFEGEARDAATPTKGFDEVAPAPDVDVTPLALNYGTVIAGNTSDLTVTVSNTATTDALAVGLYLGGLDADQFLIVSTPSPTFNVPAGGNQVVTVRYAPTAGGAHNATLTLLNTDATSGTVVVTLAGTGDCQFNLPVPSVNVSDAATTGSFDVQATVCDWTAIPNDAWLQVLSGSPGAGDGTVVYGVDQNLGAARVGTISIESLTFTVNQDGTTSVHDWRTLEP